jgi:hypothetical protein
MVGAVPSFFLFLLFYWILSNTMATRLSFMSTKVFDLCLLFTIIPALLYIGLVSV